LFSFKIQTPIIENDFWGI